MSALPVPSRLVECEDVMAAMTQDDHHTPTEAAA